MLCFTTVNENYLVYGVYTSKMYTSILNLMWYLVIVIIVLESNCHLLADLNVVVVLLCLSSIFWSSTVEGIFYSWGLQAEDLTFKIVYCADYSPQERHKKWPQGLETCSSDNPMQVSCVNFSFWCGSHYIGGKISSRINIIVQ